MYTFNNVRNLVSHVPRTHLHVQVHSFSHTLTLKCAHACMTHTHTSTHTSLHGQVFDRAYFFAVMLEWFVLSADIRKALAGELLGEEPVETRPEKIPDCCTDENVNVYHIKKYFTSDA